MSPRGFSPASAIVTASDSGIGAATALALADAGMDVGVTWHSDQEGAERTAEAVRERGRRAVVARFDATAIDEVASVVDRLADDLGGLDVFVNNAGGGTGGPFLEVSTDQWRKVIALNLDGEPTEVAKARFEIVPARVRMHLPTKSPLLSNPAPAR